MCTRHSQHILIWAVKKNISVHLEMATAMELPWWNFNASIYSAKLILCSISTRKFIQNEEHVLLHELIHFNDCKICKQFSVVRGFFLSFLHFSLHLFVFRCIFEKAQKICSLDAWFSLFVSLFRWLVELFCIKLRYNPTRYGFSSLKLHSL